MKWIPLTNSHPSEQQKCLLRFASGVEVIGRMLQGSLCWYSFDDDRYYEIDNAITKTGITHWCPLPSLPEEVDSTSPTNEVNSQTDELATLRAENEAVRFANLDCVANFEAIRSDYETLRAENEALREENTALAREMLTPHVFHRLVEWLREPSPRAASAAFTASIERQIAYALEMDVLPEVKQLKIKLAQYEKANSEVTKGAPTHFADLAQETGVPVEGV